MPKGAFYTVRNCLGKYSSWYYILYGKKSFRREIRTIEKFFDFFPDKKLLRQFNAEDVDDWAVEQGKHVSKSTVSIRLEQMNRFWRWVHDKLGYELPNPVTRVYHKRKLHEKAKTLSLDELRVLYLNLPVSSQRYILASVIGLQLDGCANPCVFYHAVRKVGKLIGVKYRAMDIKKSLPNLRLTILQDFRDQVCDTLAMEPKGNSTALGNVQVSEVIPVPFYERPPICDAHIDDLPIIRINKPKLCIEWEPTMGDC